MGAQCGSCMLPTLRLGCAALPVPQDVAPWQPLPAPAVHPKQWLPTAMRPPARRTGVGVREIKRRSGWSLTGSPAVQCACRRGRSMHAMGMLAFGHATARAPALPQGSNSQNRASRPPSPVSSSRLSMSKTVLCCAAGSPSSSCWLKSQSYNLQGKRNATVAVARNARKCPLPRLRDRPNPPRLARLHRLFVDWPSLHR